MVRAFFGGGQAEVVFDLAHARLRLSRTHGGFSGDAEVALDPARQAEVLAAAEQITPSLQDHVREDFHAWHTEIVEVHRGAERVRLENPRGSLCLDETSPLVDAAHQLLQRHLPVPPE